MSSSVAGASRAPEIQEAPQRRPFPLGAVCAALVALTWVGAAVRYGADPSSVGAYAAALAWTVLLPGFVLVRLTRPGATLLADACWAFVAGLPLQLLVWLVGVRTGLPWLLTAAPLLALATLASPRLRARLRPGPYRRTAPAGVLALTAASTVVLMRNVVPYFAKTPLAPTKTAWYQDLYWHASITSGLTRSVPPQVQQVDGQRLDYHWFSNAHMAAASIVSHQDVLLVLSRLWIGPVLLAALGCTYLLGARLGRSTAGVIALAVLTTGAALPITSWVPLPGADPFTALSPSQVFGMPLMTASALLLVEAVRGRLGRGGALLLALLLVACTGAKSSILPTLGCGVGLALLVSLRTRVHRRVTAGWLAAMIVLVLATAPFLAGGSQESSFGPGLLDFLPLSGRAAAPSGSAVAVVAGVLTVVTLLLQRAAPWWLIGARAWPRADPAVWLLAGACLAAVLALLLIDHPSLSQVYFVRGVAPLFAALTGAGVAGLVGPVSGASARRDVVTGALMGFGAALIPSLLLTPGRAPLPVEPEVLVRLGGVALVWIGLLAWTAWWLRRRTGTSDARRRVGAGMLGAMAAGVVLPTITTPLSSSDTGSSTALLVILVVTAWAAVLGLVAHRRRAGTACAVSVLALVAVAAGLLPRAVDADTLPRLPAGTAGAADWVRSHVPDDQMLATNVHCLSDHDGSRPRPGPCDSRAFWTTGLTGRQAYVESWGYTEQARAAQGKGGRTYVQQPFFDRERLRRNDRAFTHPTRAGLAALRRAGVRWLVADPHASPVSARLDRLAPVVHRSGAVTVHRLP